MELNKIWTVFLMMGAFTLGWFLYGIGRETNINISHHGQTILNAGIRIFKGNTNTVSVKLNGSTSVPDKKLKLGILNVHNNRNLLKERRNNAISEKQVTRKHAFHFQQTSKLIKVLPTVEPSSVRLYTRNAKQWTRDEKTCKSYPKFMQATLRTSAGALPIFIHNPKDDIHVSNSVLKYGSWEGGYIDLILTFLRQDPKLQFLDLGANIGVYSMAVAKFGRKVVAVDALAINIQRLCATVKLNNFTNNVQLIYNALSDVHETVSLGADRGNIGGTFVAKDKNPNKVRGSRVSGNYGNVQTATLDDILKLPDFNLEKVIIKMDVEGYENRVFRGGENFFNKVNVRAVLMEWMWLKTGPAGQEIIDFLTRHGFQPTRPSLATQLLPLTNRLSWPNDVLWRRKQ
ncbi:uncharacterized protein LOC133205359 [Saccostrea echinata]|uniref:uncharacterized protein LOC133205359 n=1 Tax=Saccostrea echinata TaxID=191078 RepID=UPI002A83E4CE|nr:uncharacterized protein LOC133205359 [Saccostrea echinata]